MQKKRWTVLIAILVFFIIFSLFVKNKNNENFSYDFDKIVPNLIVYNFDFIDNKNKNFVILEKEFLRIVPQALFELSDVFIGYGISKDIELEDNFSIIYKKPSFGFDCGIKTIKTKSKNCSFSSECIVSDKYIKTELGQISSKKVHTFSDKIKELNLEDKKIFLKLSFNINGEYEALLDILKNQKNKNQIAAIALAIQPDLNSIQKTNETLELLKDDFVLVSRGGLRKTERNSHSYYERKINTKTFKGSLGCDLLFLVYVNKNLLKNYSISLNQNDDLFFKFKDITQFEVNKNLEIKKRKIKKTKTLNIPTGKIKCPFVIIKKFEEFKKLQKPRQKKSND